MDIGMIDITKPGKKNDNEAPERRWCDELKVICNLLACRLKELAFFLNSLLKHEEVLNVLAKNRHEEIRKAIENSLDISRNIPFSQDQISLTENILTQTSSISPNIINDSNLESILYEINCQQLKEPTIDAIDSPTFKNKKTDKKSSYASFEQLDSVHEFGKSSQTDGDNELFFNQQMLFYKEIAVKIDHLHGEHTSRKDIYSEHFDSFQKETESLRCLREEMCQQLAKKLEKYLVSQRSGFLQDLVLRKDMDSLKLENQELMNHLSKKTDLLHTMDENVNDLRNRLSEKEKQLYSLKRSLDEVTLQTSKAVLERTKYMNERDSVENHRKALKEKHDQLLTESSELHTKLAKLGHANAQLLNKLVLSETNLPSCQDKIPYPNGNNVPDTNTYYYTEDDLSGLGSRINDDVHSTGQQSISSLSKDASCKSNEVDDSGNTVIPTEEFLFDGHPVHDHHNCGSVEQENVELRRKLEKTRRAFEKTWAQLRLSNQRKEQIEKDIRHEIYKTHNVLKNVRSNIENVNNEGEVKTS